MTKFDNIFLLPICVFLLFFSPFLAQIDGGVGGLGGTNPCSLSAPLTVKNIFTDSGDINESSVVQEGCVEAVEEGGHRRALFVCPATA